MALPVIAIVGRPNVGKSTLFNRLIGERHAVMSDVAGTTRDRIYHEAELGGYNVILVDTGGLDFGKNENIEADVQAQARLAVDEADLILFVVDGTCPLTSSDLDAAHFLRKSKKKIIFIAHKCDNQKSLLWSHERLELGLGEPLAVSSIHNLGVEELDEEVGKCIKKLKLKKEKFPDDDFVRIALVGKPNVGKSSMVNALLRKERLIVSDVPGTTIDAIDSALTWNDQQFILIDTAGLRRRGRIEKGIEKHSVLRSLQAISRAYVTCLVLDFDEGIANQDLHISNYILEAGKGLIIVVNKEDLMDDREEEQKEFLRKLHYRMDYIPWAPVIFTSALTKKNTHKILELGAAITKERDKEVPAKEFEVFTKAMILAHPPTRSAHKILIRKGEQTGTRPPTFTFWCNEPDLIHFSYRRFLENEIRRKYGFYGTSIQLFFKAPGRR